MNLDLIFAEIMLKEMMQINMSENREMRGCVIARHFWKINMLKPFQMDTQKTRFRAANYKFFYMYFKI